jgi:hypothetical protein
MFCNSSQNSPLTQRTSVNMDIPLTNGGNNHQRSTCEFSSVFRNIFHRSPKRNVLQSEKEMTNLSKVLIKSDETTETLANITNNPHKEDLCLFSDSPHYIVRV